MDIKVGFSTSTSLISRIVRFFTRSKISHTFLLLDKAFLGGDMVLQANPGGFVLLTYEAFQSSNEVLELVELSHSILPGLQRSTGWLGKKYDYLAVLGLVPVLAGRAMGRKWRNPFNTKSVFCSEVIVHIMKASGYPGSESLDADSMTPQDLHDFLKKAEG